MHGLIVAGFVYATLSIVASAFVLRLIVKAARQR